MIKTIENLVFSLKMPILLGLAAFTTWMAWLATGLYMDAGFEKQLPKGHEYIETFREYQTRQPGANRIIVVLRDKTGKTIWNKEFLATLNGLTQDMFYIPGVDRNTVTSLWTPNTRFFEITEEGINAENVVGSKTNPMNVGDTKDTSIDRIQTNVIRGGFVGRLVSKDFTSAMVVAELLEYDWNNRDEEGKPARLNYFQMNDRLEQTIRTRFEAPGGPALWNVEQRLDELRLNNLRDAKILAADRAKLAGLKAQDPASLPSDAARTRLQGEIATLEARMQPLEARVGACAAPSGFVYDLTNRFSGGDKTTVLDCSAYASELKDIMVRTVEGQYGPVVGPYYATFKQKLDDIVAAARSDAKPDGISPAEQYKRITAEIDAWRAAVKDLPSQYEVHMIGFAKAYADIGNGAVGAINFFGLAFVLTILAVWYYCRSWKLTLLAVGCSLTSVIWQFGLLVLLGYGLDPLAILVPFLVFAIGVSHGIQQLNLITAGLVQGLSPEQAARKSFSGLLIPGSMALTTDLAGFATLYLVPIPMIQELAVTSSIGVALKIVTNLIMLPLVASMLKFRTNYPAQVERAREDRLPLMRALGQAANPKYAPWITLFYFVVFGFAVWQGLQRHIGNVHPGMPELKPDHRYNVDARTIAGLDPKNPEVRLPNTGYDQALDIYTVIVETPYLACNNYNYMEYLDRFTWHMRNVDGVLSVFNVSNVAKGLNAGWNEGNIRWRGLPQNPKTLQQSAGLVPSATGLVNQACTVLPLQIFLKDGKAETIMRVSEAVKWWRDNRGIPPVLNKGLDTKIKGENLGSTWLLKPAELDGLTYVPQLGWPNQKAGTLNLTVTGFKALAPIAAGAEGWIVDAQRLDGLVIRPSPDTPPSRDIPITVTAFKKLDGGQQEALFETTIQVPAGQIGTKAALNLKRALQAQNRVAEATEFHIKPVLGAELGYRDQAFSKLVSFTPGEKPGVAQPFDLKGLLAGENIAAAEEIEVQGVEDSFYIRLAAGNSGIQAAVNEEVEHQELPMTLIVYGIIIALVIFTFRDWRATVCCTIPLTFATFFGYWFMKEMDIGLKVSTLPVMVLAVGIGVDYAFYIYDRLQEHLAHGMSLFDGYVKSMEETGNAIIFTAITLAIGVSTWAFSDLKFQADMGLLLTFMFVINMTNALTALPAIAATLDLLVPRKAAPKFHGITFEDGAKA
jgi:predicted RND superfamily exporter protein